VVRLGLALPLSVAVVLVMSVVASVITAGTAEVVNISTVPKRVPTALAAIAQ
jgi:hypothetical protein